MADKNGNVLKKKSVIIKPSGFTIPSDAAAVHGITTERAQREGQPLDTVMEEFMNDVQLAASVVGHNIDFDMHIVGAELYRLDMDYDLLMDKPCTCTMKSSTDFCAIPNPNPYFGGYKWPSLQELYCKLFGHEFSDAHDALADITATKECFFELKRRGIIKE
jgi:DNA polymerase III epsilon subunit-like protein